MPEDAYICEVKVTGVVFASSKEDAREKIRKVLRAPCSDDCVFLEHDEPLITHSNDAKTRVFSKPDHHRPATS